MRNYLQTVRIPNPILWSNPKSTPETSNLHHSQENKPWWQVLWLTGVDYFSTLAYQPGIAFLAAGVLSPIATLILIAVTLFGALPVYRQVASRSYAGQGSIAMLERMLSGWAGKIAVLILIGFALTDFIITMTLSAADAAQHIIENPLLKSLGFNQVTLTLMMLSLLGGVFLLGFREAIRFAMLIAIPYICLNVVVLIGAVSRVVATPSVLDSWSTNVFRHGDITGIALICAFVFPKLALGLSGFETGVSAMPLIEGEPQMTFGTPPRLRIDATKKLLTAAALIMSILLIWSSFVTTVLIPEKEFAQGGAAYGRAISYLAHLIFGVEIGTIYDISTIAILWFAGASAMTGLLQIIPRYLPKFGMAPDWVGRSRPLVILITLINFFITLVFKANVESQSSAYATGVLALILSASFAVALSFLREGKAMQNTSQQTKAFITSAFFWVITLVFVYTLLDNIIQRIDGLIMALSFIVITIVLSVISRLMRATEVRVDEMHFIDDTSAKIWSKIKQMNLHLVAVAENDRELRKEKEAEIRKHYFVNGPLVFLYIELVDDRSEFIAHLSAEVHKEGLNFIIHVRGANAIANTIAFVSEAIRPKGIFLSLTRKNLLGQALRFLLWGEGETGLMVYRILLRRWHETHREGGRPLIFLMSN